MSFYGEMAKTAEVLLSKYGRKSTLRKQAKAHDPVTGGVTATSADHTIICAEFSYTAHEGSIDDAILRTDRKILISPNGQRPEVNDSVIANGTVYNILNIKAVDPTTEHPVLYIAQVRS